MLGAHDRTARRMYSGRAHEYTGGGAHARSSGSQTMLQAGDSAPRFVLAGDGGRKVDSQSLKGRRHVIYFYPKDDTPGCTREACAFRDQLPAFEKLDVPVFGVSGDEVKAHDRFVHKYGLNFPLLADPGHKLLEAYGVWVEKSMYGRKYFGIQRSSFVVDAKGRIEKVWEKVSPDQHADEVLAYLRGEPPATKKKAGAAAPAKPAKPAKPR
jgi:peroxiredoxin Q/BCP